MSSRFYVFQLDIRDKCVAAEGLTITSDIDVLPTAVTYYLDGSQLELNQSLPFTSSYPTNCPVSTYTCRFVFSSGVVEECDSTDPGYSFDSSTGALTLHSSNTNIAGETVTF